MAEEEQAIHAAYGKAGTGVGGTPGGPGKGYWVATGYFHPNAQNEAQTTMGDEAKALGRTREDKTSKELWQSNPQDEVRIVRSWTRCPWKTQANDLGLQIQEGRRSSEVVAGAKDKQEMNNTYLFKSLFYKN